MATVTIEHARGVLSLVLFQVPDERAAALASHYALRHCHVHVEPEAQADDPCTYCDGEAYTIKGDESGTWHEPCPACDLVPDARP